MLTNYIVFELELLTNSIDSKTTTVTLDYFFLNKLSTVQYKELESSNLMKYLKDLLSQSQIHLGPPVM